jgi:copper transport protein
MRRSAQALLLFVTVFAAALPVFAHAKLVASRPSASESVTRSPEQIELDFNAPVQPAMSSIAVTGPGGSAIATGPLGAKNDARTVFAALPDLATGEYRVAWRALSADDHMIEGDFTFRVDGPAGSAALVERTPEVDHSAMDHSTMGHAMPREENINWPQSLIRWLIYIAMMLAAGGLAFRLFVLPTETIEPALVDRFDRRLRFIVFAASGLLTVALLVSLYLQTAAVFGSVDMSGASSILTDTTFGVPWMIQIGCAAAVMLALLLSSGVRAGSFLWVAFGLSLLSLLGPSLSGHARAASVDYPLTVPADWLHLAAAAVWVGGLGMIGFALPVIVSALDAGQRLRYLADSIRRFNRLAIAATVVLALTGVYNSWIHVESFTALAGTVYGRVLMAKVGITALMVVLGGLNAFVLQPRLRAFADGAEITADRSLFRNVAVEIAFAAIVLLLAAILAFLPPAREHSPRVEITEAFSWNAI